MNLAEFNQSVREIRDDRVRGASELARRCLDILMITAGKTWPNQSAAELQRCLLELADELATTRPSMTVLQNLLRQWRQGFTSHFPLKDLAAVRQAAVNQAEQLIAASQQAVRDCAGYAAELLGRGRTVLTHSRSSTVVEVCRLLKDADLRMIVTESRPLEEGRQWAEQLAAWQVPTTYITDAQMGLFVAQADAVLVGADSILTDGSVVNKAGTYLLALAARASQVPFYVCAENLKWRRAEQPPLTLEEMATAELGVPDWPGVTVRNVYFDITPPELVSAWISEQGCMDRMPKR